MRDIQNPMLWADAVIYFENEILPQIRMTEAESGGGRDWPMRREAWNNWTDALCKDGEISDWQYENWSQPLSCGD